MYFSSFPLLPYTFDNGETWNLLRDVTIRTRIIEENFVQTAMYHYFAVNDGASPEDIATEIYGTPYLHWVILLSNDIIDPVMDWPWSDDRLREYTFKKYRKEVLTLANSTGFFPQGSVMVQDRKVDPKDPSKTIPKDPVFARLVKQVSAKYYTDGEGFDLGPVYLESNPSVTSTIVAVEYDTVDNVLNEQHHVVDVNGIIKQEKFDEGGFPIREEGDRVITHYDFESEINERNREIRVLRPEYLRPFIQEFKRLINE